MSSDRLNFDNMSVLAEGSQGTFDHADGMRNDIQMLISDVENIPQAIQGVAGDTFVGAGRGIGECFADLLDWCQTNGMNMAEAQRIFDMASNDSIETYMSVGNEISGLSRGVNG